VQRSTWEQHQDEWWYEIEAEAFLYHMVRRLVYVQVAVAQGRLPLQKVQQVLVPTAWALERPPRASKREAGQKVPSGLAPAQGLTLMEVKY
jgi:tRNA pseudouridine38-40 synthase